MTELQLPAAGVAGASLGDRNDDNIRLLNDNIRLIGDRYDTGESSSPPAPPLPKLSLLLGTSIEKLTGFFFLRSSVADEQEEEDDSSHSHSEHNPDERGSSEAAAGSPIWTITSGSEPISTGDLQRGHVE